MIRYRVNNRLRIGEIFKDTSLIVPVCIPLRTKEYFCKASSKERHRVLYCMFYCPMYESRERAEADEQRLESAMTSDIT